MSFSVALYRPVVRDFEDASVVAESILPRNAVRKPEKEKTRTASLGAKIKSGK